jgi:ribosome biogenesis GTPase A
LENQVCLRTLTENVINLAVENCLVCDMPDIITPKKVDRMSEDRLKELALESEEVQAEREVLRKQVEILRQGLRKCRQHRPRELTGSLKTFQRNPVGFRC